MTKLTKSWWKWLNFGKYYIKETVDIWEKWNCIIYALSFILWGRDNIACSLYHFISLLGTEEDDKFLPFPYNHCD